AGRGCAQYLPTDGREAAGAGHRARGRDHLSRSRGGAQVGRPGWLRSRLGTVEAQGDGTVDSLHTTPPAAQAPLLGEEGRTSAWSAGVGYALPHTSRAVSTTSRSFAACDSRAISLPCTVLENPHCGDRHS